MELLGSALAAPTAAAADASAAADHARSSKQGRNEGCGRGWRSDGMKAGQRQWGIFSSRPKAAAAADTYHPTLCTALLASAAPAATINS